jgi:hypothetical protein
MVSREQRLEAQRVYWEKIRNRGRGSFILRRGMLGLGVPWTVLMALIGTFTPLFGDRPPIVPVGVPSFLAHALYILPFGLAAGVLWAIWTWRTLQRQFAPGADRNLPDRDSAV